ncbi:uncharacterized protein FYW49_013194 [Xenentodon cancila]
MLCSRCVLSFLGIYLLLEEISAAVLPSGVKNKREVNWLDREVFSRLSHLSDAGDLSVGDAGEMSRDVDSRPPRSETLIAPTEHVSVQVQIKHKPKEKRRKVAPLDPIGRFQMSSFRNQKDEPEIHKDYRN